MLVTVLGLLGVLVVLFVGGVLATRDTGLLRDDPPDRAPLTTPGDLEAVRFSLAVRGYRMAEVDEVLDRAGATLALLQQQLAETQVELLAARSTTPSPGGPQPTDPASTERADPVADVDWRAADRPGTIEP